MLKQNILVPSFSPTPPPCIRIVWIYKLRHSFYLLVPFGSKARHWRHRIYSPVYVVSNNEIMFYHPVIAIGNHNKWWCTQNHVKGNLQQNWRIISLLPLLISKGALLWPDFEIHCTNLSNLEIKIVKVITDSVLNTLFGLGIWVICEYVKR